MSASLKPLDQQVIVITGASSGIGLVTAKAAAAAGARVLLVARSEDALKAAVEEIVGNGGTADFKVADVGDRDAMMAVADHARQRFGGIDTWVNNAGVAIYGDVLDVPDDEHHQLFRTNYFGVVHGCEAAVPALRDHGGALVTVASIAADIPSPKMGVYAASKHAVKAYVHALRMELSKDHPHIAVTLIKPSGIDTPVANHAANHAGGEAMVPPPVYDPALVADAILAAAVTPRRDITVGGAGRFNVLFGQHFPTLFEWLAPKRAVGFVDKDSEQPTPSNLFEPVRAGHERSAKQDGRSASLYTSATLHPLVTSAVLVGTLVAGVAATSLGRRSDDD